MLSLSNCVINIDNIPKCKNDLLLTYKGTEPSPKGLGYCTHVSLIGLKKKGNNGKMWVVKKYQMEPNGGYFQKKS